MSTEKSPRVSAGKIRGWKVAEKQNLSISANERIIKKYYFMRQAYFLEHSMLTSVQTSGIVFTFRGNSDSLKIIFSPLLFKI